MPVQIGREFVADLCINASDMPTALVDALACTVTQTNIAHLTRRPDITPTQTRVIYDRVGPAMSNAWRGNATAGHIAALGNEPALDEFISELGLAREATGRDFVEQRRFDEMLQQAFAHLSSAQIVQLSTSSNLLATATLAGFAKLSPVDRLAAIRHLNASVTDSADALVSEYVGLAIGELREDDWARGELAVLSTTHQAIFDDLSLTFGRFTTAEATHIAKVTVMPYLEDDSLSWADWIPGCIEAQGPQMDPALLIEIAGHPNATPDLRLAVAAAQEVADGLDAGFTQDHQSHNAATEFLKGAPSLTKAQWIAALKLLELLPADTTADAACAVVAAVAR